MKKVMRTLFLLSVIAIIFLTSCIIDTGYRSVDITDVYTDPVYFDANSQDDYTFSVTIDYGNFTLQEAILEIEVHKGDDYYSMVTEEISMMDEDSITLSFTDNASNWTYRNEWSFYAYIYSAKVPLLSRLTDITASESTVYYFSP